MTYEINRGPRDLVSGAGAGEAGAELAIGEDVRRSCGGTYGGGEGTKGDKGGEGEGEGEGSCEVSSGNKPSLARISKELISSGRFRASRSSRYVKETVSFTISSS